jgi:hypothetical protein
MNRRTTGGRLERAPVRDRAAGKVDLSRWRAAVAALLASEWDPARTWAHAKPEHTYDRLAETIVAMFDAGARDLEVEQFLALLERDATTHTERLTRERRAIVEALHRAARTAVSQTSSRSTL